MKYVAALLLAVFSLLTVQKVPPPWWVTERPICVDTSQTHNCTPNAGDFLGG